MKCRTHDGRAFRLLMVIDEYSRQCLAIDVARRLTSEDVLECLTDLFIRRAVPGYMRSDNGPEFTAKRAREWLDRIGFQTLFIEPGSPWENGYSESFNGKLRDELLGLDIFDTLQEAEVLTERWRWEYNTFRPHSALGYRAPAPEAILLFTPAPLRFSWCTDRHEKIDRSVNQKVVLYSRVDRRRPVTTGLNRKFQGCC